MSFLTYDEIDHESLIREVLRDRDGAVCFFAGVVRDHHEGKSVSAIDYEAYESMAEKEIGKVMTEVEQEHPEVSLRVVHRLGHLIVGDTSIAIAASSPHRAEAFEACRKVIDRVKETVPIWKKEYGPDGTSWVGWQGSRPDEATDA